MTGVADDLLESVRFRLVKESPVQIRECLDMLDEDQVWWRPNAASNAVGTLVIHLCGATRHFLGRGVGGTNYVRDRAGEFAATAGSKLELRRTLDATVAETDAVLAALTPARLGEPVTGVDVPWTVFACLMRMSHHWSFHAGQIVYVTKLLREGSVADLYRRSMAP